ncbi:MAG: hypothetical protein H6707_09260 [Deltaproteobacteria bacterium]|nr:hypothetical protein [Deltaproteobacteria bacterium]
MLWEPLQALVFVDTRQLDGLITEVDGDLLALRLSQGAQAAAFIRLNIALPNQREPLMLDAFVAECRRMSHDYQLVLVLAEPMPLELHFALEGQRARRRTNTCWPAQQASAPTDNDWLAASSEPRQTRCLPQRQLPRPQPLARGGKPQPLVA